MPLLASDFFAGLSLGEDTALPALGVDVPPVEGDPLDLVGVVLEGVLVADGTVVAVGVTTLELEEVLGVGVVPALPTDRLRMATFAGTTLTLACSTWIGGALLNTTGIAVPAALAGTRGGSGSAGATAGRSARPSAKQQTNTTAPASTENIAARA